MSRMSIKGGPSHTLSVSSEAESGDRRDFSRPNGESFTFHFCVMHLSVMQKVMVAFYAICVSIRHRSD